MTARLAGTADQRAEAVAWLVSDAASSLTGLQLDLNRGLPMA